MDVPRLSTFENTKKNFIQRCVSILYISNIRKNSCFFDEYIFSQEKKVELGSFSKKNGNFTKKFKIQIALKNSLFKL